MDKFKETLCVLSFVKRSYVNFWIIHFMDNKLYSIRNEISDHILVKTFIDYLYLFLQMKIKNLYFSSYVLIHIQLT